MEGITPYQTDEGVVSYETHCKFCLKHVDGEDIIIPCKCILYHKIDVQYCHVKCLTEYRTQCYNNREFIQCGICKKAYKFTIDSSTIEEIYYCLRINYITRLLYYLVVLALYISVLIVPMGGIGIMYKYVIFKDAELNSDNIAACFFLASATWIAITSLYWLICISNFYCIAIHTPFRYSHGFTKYHDGYYPIYGMGWCRKYPERLCSHIPKKNENESTCDYLIRMWCPNCDIFFICFFGILIIVPGIIIFILVFYSIILFGICIQLTNNRYKKYVKSTICILYKISTHSNDIIYSRPKGYSCGFMSYI